MKTEDECNHQYSIIWNLSLIKINANRFTVSGFGGFVCSGPGRTISGVTDLLAAFGIDDAANESWIEIGRAQPKKKV